MAYIVGDWTKVVVDLKYHFSCDLLIELSDNKLYKNNLSDNNLASNKRKVGVFLKPIRLEEIAIFFFL